ncbi:MAG: dockerin type I domain-containing protein, partial [Acutalibacteraceae bacterium]
GTSGNTNMVSGTYGGFEGYYNFFNYSASGNTTDEITVAALTYAKNNGWNSRTAAIIGGAKKYADGYISIGQDTYYYKDFNLVNQVWWHQYASALYDAWTNAKYLRKGCIDNTDAALIFSIPVFSEMPQSACPYPTVTNIEVTPPKPVIKKGDTNNDNNINAIDLAAVKMNILGVRKLEGDAALAGDINDDGAINAIDLAAIKMHILGVKLISQ